MDRNLDLFLIGTNKTFHGLQQLERFDLFLFGITTTASRSYHYNDYNYIGLRHCSASEAIDRVWPETTMIDTLKCHG